MRKLLAGALTLMLLLAGCAQTGPTPTATPTPTPTPSPSECVPAPEVPDSLRTVGDVDGDGVSETLMFGGFDQFGTTGSLWVDGKRVLTLESEGAFGETTCRLAAANLDGDGRSEVLVLLDVPARSGSVPFRLLKLTDGVWQERTALLPHLTLTLSDGWTAALTDGSQTWTEEVTNPEVRAAWFDGNGAPTAEDLEAWAYADRTEFYILEGTVRFTAHVEALDRAAAGREGEPALDRAVSVTAAVEDGQIVVDDSLAETVMAWLADPAPELAAARDLIDGDRWLHAALNCIFDDPKDLDLGLLFREGFYGLPGGGEASQEERDYLKQQGLEFDCPVQRLPVSLLNEVLERYFGVTLDDVAVPEDWYWRADTGCCYSFYSDFYGVALWAPLKVERQGGDFILTYVPYPWQAIPNPKTGEPVTAAVMTLREQPEGGWLVASNVDASAGRYQFPMENTKKFQIKANGLTPDEAALALAGMFMDDLMTPPDDRTFLVTEYKNLSVAVTPTTQLSEAALDGYAVRPTAEEIGENRWMVAVDVDFRYCGFLDTFGNGVGQWLNCLHQGSPVDFLLTLENGTYTLQSRWK